MGLFTLNKPAQKLYFLLVRQARKPIFYINYGVPDSLDGHFEMIVLHVVLILRRLREEPNGRAFGDHLFEVLTSDLDRSLRDMGKGDMGVGKKVREMARGFYGRAEAYDRALDGKENLEDVLIRNLFGTVSASDQQVAAMAGYVRLALEKLQGVTGEKIMKTEILFPSPPPFMETID